MNLQCRGAIPPAIGNSGSFARRTAAFTLVELLVVIAVVGLLAALLLPSLAASKQRAQRSQCLNNTRQLSLAWRIYADDHHDRLVHNFDEQSTRETITRKSFANWVNNILDWAPDDTWGNFNPDFLRNGGVAPYLGYSQRIFRCPADVFLSPQQRAGGYGLRARSLSLNASFGEPELAAETPARGLPASFARSGGYVNWRRLSAVPHPARFWIFIDEHPDSIRDGRFFNPPAPHANSWSSLPASHHAGGSSLAFADGHAEVHQWRSATTVRRVRYAFHPEPFDEAGLADYRWLRERTTLPE